MFDATYNAPMKRSRGLRVLVIVGGACACAPLVLSLWLRRLYPALGLPTDAVMTLLFYLVGAAAVGSRPTHRAARWLFLIGLVGSIDLTLGRYLSLLSIYAGRITWFWAGSSLVTALDLALFCAVVSLLAVFPDGHYHHNYERPVVNFTWLFVPSIPILLLVSRPFVFWNSYEILPGPNRHARSPFYLPAFGPLGAQMASVAIPFLLLLLVGVSLLFLRYRAASPDHKRQMMWPMLAILAFGGALLIAVGAELGWLPAAAATTAFDFTVLLFPIAISIGLLRHQLFNVELVLQKSLVYGALWLTITAVFTGLSAALGLAAGGMMPVNVAILITIVATLVLQPVQRALERLADRLVFGQERNPYELLAQFGEVLEATPDMEGLIPQLLTAVRQGLDAQWVRILLAVDRESHNILVPVAADGIDLHEETSPTLSAPLIHAGVSIGRIDCGSKPEAHFDHRDQELLTSLGRQAALAIRSAHLMSDLTQQLDANRRQSAELAASRSRLVRAGDEERRRIERNIHDGVQQELAALLAKIRLARNQIARDPLLGMKTLEELQEDTRQTLDDLREVVRGIHPPLLSDRGLVEAIESHVRRMPISTILTIDGVERGTRYVPEVEGGIYFFVCEALANVLKHAAAQQVHIHITQVDYVLQAEVRDDGRGFNPDFALSSGLRGLQDRLEALDGRLQIASTIGHGTIICASVPVVRGRDHD